jgi:hypothetical protein
MNNAGYGVNVLRRPDKVTAKSLPRTGRMIRIVTPTILKIRIANPQPGSARYTTANQAERYVRRKEAIIIDSQLHFLSPAEQRRMQTFNRIIQSERRASDVYIRGIVWWDGSDPGGMHRPGEVIS